MAVDDIIHRLFLAQPPQKGPHTPASMCGSGWPRPSCLSGWASFLVRPGFPPNESWAAGRLLSRSQVFALWLNKSCQRGAGLYLGLSPSPVASRLAQRAGGGCYDPGLRCLTPPALASSVQFFYLTGSHGQAWSIASSPPTQQPPPLRGPLASMVFVPLTGLLSLVGELPFPEIPCFPLRSLQ